MTPRRFPARAILLDWDGTILNSYAADSRAYLQMFRALGINWGLRELARHYSPNWHNVYRAAKVPRHAWEDADRLWYEAYDKESPELLAGARAAIERMAKSFTLGVVTSGNRRRVHKQLRDFRLDVHFAVCVCAEDAAHRKPHPAPLKLALQKLKLEPELCIYVGDAPEDVEMARRARVRVFGVCGPFPTAARVRAAKPDAMLASIRELPRRIIPIA
ncbi:MAG TPA: HAD family hydrolase [Candidatus Acidoferrales bacterium]|nr:HAD family hydrolase [Candidatus Acidoferrales bacterium]